MGNKRNTKQSKSLNGFDNSWAIKEPTDLNETISKFNNEIDKYTKLLNDFRCNALQLR